MRSIINRKGIRETLNIEKIREKLVRACKGLEVNMVELESHVDSIYEEIITTSKIQQPLINLAVSMTSFEKSDWATVAGRLLMMEVEREVYHNRGFSYENFSHTIADLSSDGIYDSKFSKEDIEELGNYIDPERDMLFDYAGANMFSTRYLLKHNGLLWELPQEVFMTIAMMLSLDEEKPVKMAKIFYDALSLERFP